MTPADLRDVDALDGEAPLGLGCALESFADVRTVEELIKNLEHVENDSVQLETEKEKFQKVLDQYQEQPHLLDRHLDWMLSTLLSIARSQRVSSAVMHQCFSYLYHITKVRHYKVVVRHLPHEVSDLESVLAMLSSKDSTEKYSWETSYVLLLWLSIIIIIPFHLSRLDSIPIGDGYQKKPVATRVMEEGLKYLTTGNKSQDAAAYLIAKFVTRPDAKDNYMPQFIDWAIEALNKCEKDVQLQRGVMLALALLFKHGKREDLLPYIRTILKQILQGKFISNTEMIVRKLSIKLVQRLGLNFLKPRVASWRYKRGKRLLVTNLMEKTANDDNIEIEKSPTFDEEEDYDVPEELEDIIEQLLTGLRDKDNDVRWSSAKGVGRITGRLPKELADEVVGSVLDLFTSREGDNSWHGGCLALAELGRRGLLLPDRLRDVIPLVLKALVYDEQRGYFSVGAHIRDAACYVCWSFARAFDPKEMVAYVQQLASALLVVTVFDREVRCRRAASAAFQENVGRQGTFPHGIDILTSVDYFAVSNITRSYLELSVFVAQFREYVVPLISHLLEKKITHWDGNIRQLTAEALHKLTFYEINYTVGTVVPQLIEKATGIDLNSRHGAILALGEITHALSLMARAEKEKILTEFVDQDLMAKLIGIIPTLHKKKYFQGLGGELTRQSLCSYINKLSLAKIPLHDDLNIELWQDLLLDNLHYESEIVQKAAVEAFANFCSEYLRISAKPLGQSTVLQLLLDNLKSPSKNERIGAALALGTLPKFMLTGYANRVLTNLIDCTKIENDDTKKWVESRQAAIASVARVCITVGIESNGPSKDVVDAEMLDLIFTSMLNSLEDYTADQSRGDIGAGVREAAMSAVQSIVFIMASADPGLMSKELCFSIMTNLAQQAQEKIARVRGNAATIFVSLLHCEPNLSHIPHRNELIAIFDECKCEGVDWKNPQESYPFFIKLLDLDSYAYSVLLGLAVSVGGNIEHLVRYSNTILLNYLKSRTDAQLLNFARTLVEVLKRNVRVPRLSLALLTMTDQLLVSKRLTALVEDEANDFALNIFDWVKDEVARIQDFNKMIAATSVFCALLQSHGSVRLKALGQISLYLCHKFPRVRRETASKLYEALILYENVVNDEASERIMSILAETDWDDNVESLRPLRNELCELANVPMPRLIKKN